jgi:hypothetical protein
MWESLPRLSAERSSVAFDCTLPTPHLAVICLKISFPSFCVSPKNF